MSLDGNIFRTNDLVPLVRSVAFAHPTSLENALAERPLSQPVMICSSQARIVNTPANRVQDVFPNRSMGEDPVAFTKRFLAGERIDLDRMIGDYRETAVHQEMNLRFR